MLALDGMATVRFLNVDYDALHFHTRSLKINILSTLFRGREGVIKRVLCVRF